jgi:hypothetical protein
MGDCREIDAHHPEPRISQQCEKPSPYSRRGFHINPAIDRRDCVILAEENVDARVLESFAVIAQHQMSFLRKTMPMLDQSIPGFIFRFRNSSAGRGHLQVAENSGVSQAQASLKATI